MKFGIRRSLQRSDSKEISHEITLTDYGKLLIEMYGFAPMGNTRLPDGRNSWEINNLKSIEAMDLSDYQAFLISINSGYADIVKSLKIESKENYNIENQNQLEKLIDSINEERMADGNSRVWGLVYKITDSKTGFIRIGETDSEDQCLFIDRLKGYINKAKKVSQPNIRLNAFEQNLADYFGFSQGENLERETSSFIDEFFEGYDVEIWLCDDKLEMHSLENLITLYTNRIENEKGYDLRKNNFFNPIVGNLFESLAIMQAYNLKKLKSIIINSFDRVLPKEMVYNRLEKEGIRLSESTFDSYCKKLTGTTYYNARSEYILRTSSISSDLDARTRSWLKDKFSKEKIETLLWTIEGPDGSVNPLFLGYHLNDKTGTGFIHSFINYDEIFREWFVTDMNTHPIVTSSLISELIYTMMKENNVYSLGNNKYEYSFMYNGELRLLTIEFDEKTGEINKIEPGVQEL